MIYNVQGISLSNIVLLFLGLPRHHPQRDPAHGLPGCPPGVGEDAGEDEGGGKGPHRHEE